MCAHVLSLLLSLSPPQTTLAKCTWLVLAKNMMLHLHIERPIAQAEFWLGGDAHVDSITMEAVQDPLLKTDR